MGFQRKQFDEGRVHRSQIRSVDAKEGIIEGCAAPFNEWAPIGGAYLERLTEDTFRRSVSIGQGQRAPLLLAHSRDALPVGKPIGWDIREDGLYGQWQIDLGSDAGAEVFRQADEGYLAGLSVGFQPGSEDDIDEAGDVPRVTRGEAALREVSVVPVPAFESAQITLVRTAGLRRVADPRIAQYRKQLGLEVR